MLKNNIKIKPFLKWAGGKGQLLSQIQEKYPIALGDEIKKYAEPFVGGGAVLFDILSNYEMDSIYISDINMELINSYIVVRDSITELIEILSKMQTDFWERDSEERKEYYYLQRERFNLLKLQKLDESKVEMAALFLFLNKTCFNGLYRVNKKGHFNVPMGSYKNPLICDRENLQNVSTALQGVEIVCGDYRKCDSFVDQNTFVYFDPPYRPLTATSNFTAYSEQNFSDTEQIELAKFVNHLARRNAKVVVSNSDPKNIDERDDFFDILYEDHQIHRVSASRMINSNSEARGKISELLIVNY